MEFTFEAYFSFLDGLRTAGYDIRMFDAPNRVTDADDRVLLLRHDVDLDLDRALALAVAEKRFGVSASYFFLLTSPFYNPASTWGRDRIRRIAELGHGVGLHFDASVYGCEADDVAFNQWCGDEAQRLEVISGVAVDAVSFHRPAKVLVGAGPELTAPRLHTYLPRYLNEIEYCSDSTGVWRYGPPNDRPAIAAGRAMHLLTHAEWWSDHALQPPLQLGAILEQRAERDKVAAYAELDIEMPS